MTKEDIVKCLIDRKNGDSSKKLLAFCKEPKTMGEMGTSGIKGDMFKILVDLKKAEALAFANGKYFATPLALEVQNSL